jgi:hypothetical protein
VDLATTASLIVATFDLALVRSIRGAIHAADVNSGRGQPASGLGPAPNPEPERRFHIHPEPEYEPRPHIHPMPRVEPRTIVYVVRFEARLEPQFNAAPPVPSVEVVRPVCPIEGPFPPVWKQLPPIAPRNAWSPRRVIKVAHLQPDIRHKGLVIDMHI